MSFPARGTWIEMIHPDHPERAAASFPARGTWIEINACLSTGNTGASFPARGTWIEMDGAADAEKGLDVVPRKGNVD